MTEPFPLPRTLIVIQTIFGAPLRGKVEFRSGDIEDYTAKYLGPGNYDYVLNRLLALGWVTCEERPERHNVRGGRRAIYVYRRTRRGWQQYWQLRAKLAAFDIQLQ